MDLDFTNGDLGGGCWGLNPGSLSHLYTRQMHYHWALALPISVLLVFILSYVSFHFTGWLCTL